MLKVCVMVFASEREYERGADPIAEYVIDHDDDLQRRNLGRQCRSAFEAGQMVVTIAIPKEEY